MKRFIHHSELARDSRFVRQDNRLCNRCLAVLAAPDADEKVARTLKLRWLPSWCLLWHQFPPLGKSRALL